MQRLVGSSLGSGRLFFTTLSFFSTTFEVFTFFISSALLFFSFSFSSSSSSIFLSSSSTFSGSDSVCPKSLSNWSLPELLCTQSSSSSSSGASKSPNSPLCSAQKESSSSSFLRLIKAVILVPRRSLNCICRTAIFSGFTAGTLEDDYSSLQSPLPLPLSSSLPLSSLLAAPEPSSSIDPSECGLFSSSSTSSSDYWWFCGALGLFLGDLEILLGGGAPLGGLAAFLRTMMRIYNKKQRHQSIQLVPSPHELAQLLQPLVYQLPHPPLLGLASLLAPSPAHLLLHPLFQHHYHILFFVGCQAQESQAYNLSHSADCFFWKCLCLNQLSEALVAPTDMDDLFSLIVCLRRLCLVLGRQGGLRLPMVVIDCGPGDVPLCPEQLYGVVLVEVGLSEGPWGLRGVGGLGGLLERALDREA